MSAAPLPDIHAVSGWVEAVVYLRAFRVSRGWTHETCAGLAGSLFIEAGELLEHYQWDEGPQPGDDEALAEVRAEIADLLIYGLFLADRLHPDNPAVVLDPAPDALAVKLADPRRIARAVAGLSGQLLEDCWWDSEQELAQTGRPDQHRTQALQRLGWLLAAVARLAAVLGILPLDALVEKMARNEQRFPAV